MMRRRPPHIPLRQQIYIGCEGVSEVGYAALLQDLVNEAIRLRSPFCSIF
jgi:hypothetical protein